MVDRLMRNRGLIRLKSAAKLMNTVSRIRYGYVNRIPSHGKQQVRAFWWNLEYNFGDLITPSLLESFDLTPCWSPPDDSEIASTGSIIGMLPHDYGGFILGSGLLSDNSSIRLPRARFLAVRGPLTRDRLGLPLDTPLGDPGLLAPLLLSGRSDSRTYDLGLVPHYEDLNNPSVLRLMKKYPNRVRLINVMQSPRKVVNAIRSCRHILSSSLHGCIVADALRIPNRWILLSNRLHGKGFKFRDYYGAMERDVSPLTISDDIGLAELLESTMLADPRRVEYLTVGLTRAFRGLSDFRKARTRSAE